MPANKIKGRWEWFKDYRAENIMNVDKLTEQYIIEILTWTQSMFKYNNLPETIPKREIEFILQTSGFGIFTQVNGKYYIFRGGLGGEPNEYYLPTKAVVANPYLRYSKTLDIDKNCVVIRNDSFYHGLYSYIEETAYLLAQCDVSFKFSAINTRVPTIITASNKTAQEEAKIFIQNIEKGSKLSIIGDSPVLKGIEAFDYAKDSQSITHLIELKQYIWGTFLQRLGIQSQFNMKREALNQAETSMSADILYPLIADMLEQREIGLEKINSLYGLNIKVEKDGVWYDEQRERDLSFLKTEAEIKGKEEPKDTEENEETKEETKENDKNG